MLRRKLLMGSASLAALAAIEQVNAFGLGKMGARGGFGGLGSSSIGNAPLAGSSVDLNFARSIYFGVSGAPTSFLTTTRASTAYANDASGNWTSFANNVPRITNLGLLVEEARTNLFLNSQAPATQTITVVNASTYAVSVIGTGTLTLSGALTGSVTQGSPFIGAASSTSLTVTTSGITGTFINAQVELGASVTSPIPTAGAAVTRAADGVTLTSPPAFGAAYSMFAQGTPQAPLGYGSYQFPLSLDDGTSSNIAQTGRLPASGNSQLLYTVASAQTQVTGSSIASNVTSKLGTAIAASNQAFSLNGAASNTLSTVGVPPVSTVNIGSGAPGQGAYWNGFISRVALWPTTRISNAQLQQITT
jgi:hypothetical protein